MSIAKLIFPLVVAVLSVSLYANDTLFIQKSFSNNVFWEDASEIYESWGMDYSEWNSKSVSILFPEKNIGKEGVFFYTVDSKDGFFFYRNAFFSFEENVIYVVADPSEFAADPSLSTRIGNCLKKHFLLNFGRYRNACAKTFPLKNELKEWIKLLKENDFDILSAARDNDDYVLVFDQNGKEKVFKVPDISKIKVESQSVILDFYKEVYLLFREFANYEFAQCRWDKLVDNPERFATRSETGEIKEMRCADP